MTKTAPTAAPRRKRLPKRQLTLGWLQHTPTRSSPGPLWLHSRAMPYVARSSHPRLTNLTPMSKPATPVARQSDPTISRLPIGSPATPQQQTTFKQRTHPHSVPPVSRQLTHSHQVPTSVPQTVSDQPVRCSASTVAQPASISPPASSAVDRLSHPSTVPRSATADPRGPDYEFTPAH